MNVPVCPVRAEVENDGDGDGSPYVLSNSAATVSPCPTSADKAHDLQLWLKWVL